MRVSAQEKEEIIRLVDRSEPGVNNTLKEPGIHKSTFYIWYRAYLKKAARDFCRCAKPDSSGTRFLKNKSNW